MAPSFGVFSCGGLSPTKRGKDKDIKDLVHDCSSNIDGNNNHITVFNNYYFGDKNDVKSFAVLHGGHEKLSLEVKLEISNVKNEKLLVTKDYLLEAYGTLIIVPQDLSEEVVRHLGNEKGHIKVYIEGLSGIFPRMLCGNFSVSSQKPFNLNEACEMQFTHTNFDFSAIKQPDSFSSLGYYNQPSMPAGYGIVYPVETSKKYQ